MCIYRERGYSRNAPCLKHVSIIGTEATEGITWKLVQNGDVGWQLQYVIHGNAIKACSQIHPQKR